MAKAAASMQWMEIAPPRRVCTARRPLEKTLEPIAEECNEELMEGLQLSLKMDCEAENERFAHQGL
eukprot:Gb_20826 [translate_table: standard]